MTEQSDHEKSGAGPKAKRTSMQVKLAPTGQSDQPVLANYTALNVTPGMVLVDFGFLEPGTLAALSRLARTGADMPKALSGRLAVRVAMEYDVMAALHQQLGRLVAELKATAGRGDKSNESNSGKRASDK